MGLEKEDPQEIANYGHRSAGGEDAFETIYTGPTRIRKTKLMVAMRGNRLELWLLLGINAIIFAVIAYALLS
jgi:hypothetical protein